MTATTSVMLSSVDIAKASPSALLKVANELAFESAKEQPIRALAGHIAHAGPPAAHGEAFAVYPRRICHWIRENVKYVQETAGKDARHPLDVLNGPYHTLPPIQLGGFQFPGFGVGDCDDLSILFATMCNAINVGPAFVVGVGYPDEIGFFHAKGYCRGWFYELSKDEPYGGWPEKPLISRGLGEGEYALLYDPIHERFRRFIADPNM